MQANEPMKAGVRVSVVTIWVNVALCVVKVAAGVIAHSGAMISDAVHSLSDVLSTFAVLIGLRMAAKENDDDHPYGHERLECVAAVMLSALLLATGVGIGADGVAKISAALRGELAAPGALALAAAALSIGVKEWMYWYTRRVALRLNSTSLLADAWHHRSDAFSSVGALVGIAGARMGFPVLEPVASLLISLLVVKVGVDICKTALDQMLDKACPAEWTGQLRALALAQPGVMTVDKLKTRRFGARCYVDIEISADGSMSLIEGHAVGEGVHRAIEKAFPEVKHCMVHVNPYLEQWC